MSASALSRSSCWAQSRSPWAEKAIWLAWYNAASASRIGASPSSTPGRPRSRAVRINASAPSGQRVSASAASNRSGSTAFSHPASIGRSGSRKLTIWRSPARSMNTDENEDRRPSNRRTIAQSTPSASSPATIMSATWSEPSRLASIACPPSRAIAAAALAAPPPPVISAPFARYFSASRGISSRKKTKSTTATPVVTIFVIARFYPRHTSGRGKSSCLEWSISSLI
jgi:hypothetical protein